MDVPPKSIMESCVDFSLGSNCHHEMTYIKFDSKIHYLPPYEREIWHYELANVGHIRKAVDLFPSEKALQNLFINDMVFYLTKELRILFPTIFLMKQLHLMTEIIGGVTKNRIS